MPIENAASISNYYLTILGRAAAAAEIASWQAVSEAGAPPGFVRLSIAQSVEAKEAVASLYRSLLGRDADAAGLSAWTNGIQKGLSLADVRANFAAYPEEQADITAVYQAELGRSPDAAGNAYWTASLAGSASLDDVRRAIAASAEAQSDIASLYKAELGRGPDTSGNSYWTASLAAGASLGDIRRSIAASAEAQSDIATLYQAELGRDPDATGAASWTGSLAAGASLGDIRAAIAHSSEAQAELTALINAGAKTTLQQLTQALTTGTSIASLRRSYGGTGPSLTAVLANDTGASPSDGITQDPTVSGQVSLGTQSLRASFDGTVTAVDVSFAVNADGTFTLTPAQLATIGGGTLTPGSHILHLTAVNAVDSANAAVAFMLDGPAPVQFDLSPVDQVGRSGDHHTQSQRVTLVGTSTPGASVTLEPSGAIATATTTADNTGAFSFSGVALTLGANPITLQTSDVSGPGTMSTISFQRDAVPSGDNVIVQWDVAARAAITQDASAPPVGARAMAIESLAVFDTLSAIGGQKGYAVSLAAPSGADPQAAIAAAADAVLDALYPGRSATFDALLAANLAGIADSQAKTDGIAFGRAVAARELALRANDGSAAVPVVTGSTAPGQWRPTGPSYTPGLDPQYANVKPFALSSPGQFLPGAPPALDSAAYAASVNQVQSLGSRTSTSRTAEQTQIARFWNDQTGTDTPPGQWNQIAATVSQAAGYSLAQDARLFAELNVAEADSGIAAWNSKYIYNGWRPVTAIELGGTGNVALTADPTWQPLLTTPNFPEYAEGHGSFSGAAATVLASFFGDNTSFSATSQSLPGVTRSYTSFSQVSNEAAESRVYGGIHFQFSADAALALGGQVGAWTLKQFGTSTTPAPPRITFASVAGLSNAADPAITGQMTGATGTALAVSFDNTKTYVALTPDGNGQFTVTPSYAVDGTEDGPHTLYFQATDPQAQIANASFNFFLATRGPTITLAAGSLTDGGALTSTSVLGGTVAPARGGTLTALHYQVDSGASIPVAYDTTTNAFATTLDLFSIAPGAHTVVLTATDAAGNSASNTLRVTEAAAIPFVVTSLTPASSRADVGVTFRPMVTFSRAVDPATLTASSFYITDPSGAVVPMTIVALTGGTGAWLLPQGAMPGSSTLTIHLDGALIKATDGTPLSVAGYATVGTQMLEAFTTVSTAIVPGTTITGIVVDPGPDNTPLTPDDVSSTTGSSADFVHDTWKLPLAGVKVFVLGHESDAVFTDATGHFTLANTPSGDVKLAIDGRTASNPPAGFFFPELVHDLTVRPGVANTVAGDLGAQNVKVAEQGNPSIYLPRVHTDVFTTLSTTAPTVVHAPADTAGASGLNLTAQQIGALSVTVAPNSLLDANGSTVANATLGISPVPSALIKDELPPGLEQHTFDITIQAPGGVVFTQPAILTFPNVFGLAAGEKTYMVSFNHTTGKLEIDGTGTVSADGLTVTSDPGSGVIQPGWHGYTDPKTKTKVPTYVTPDGGVQKDFVNDYLGASDAYGSVGLAASFYSGVTNLEGVVRYGIRSSSALLGNAVTVAGSSPAGKALLTSVGKYAPVIGLGADIAGTAIDTKTLYDQSSELTTNPVMGVADFAVNGSKVLLDEAITGLDLASTVSGPAAIPEQALKDTLNTASIAVNILQIGATFVGQLVSDYDNSGNPSNPFGPRFDPTLVLHLSEDAWSGDAQVMVSIDGVQVLGPTAVTALASARGSQDITIGGIIGPSHHQITVTFVNPASGGTVDTQRNVHITGAEFNGRHFAFSNTLYGANPTPSTSFLVGDDITTAVTAGDTALQQAVSELAFQLPLLSAEIADIRTIQNFKTLYDPSKPLGGFSQADLTSTYAPAATGLRHAQELLAGHLRTGSLLANVLATTSTGLSALASKYYVPFNPPPVDLPSLTARQIIDRDAAFAAGQPYTLVYQSLERSQGVSVSTSGGGGTAVVQSLSLPKSYTFYPPGQAQPVLGSVLFGATTDEHGAVERFTYDPKMGLDRLLNPDTTYTLDAFDPKTGETGSVSFRTSPSGTDTNVPFLPLVNTGDPTGADGLTDRQAFIVGLDPTIASNLVPGLTDLAALQQGLFNTAKLPTASGIQAAVALKGEARAIALSGTSTGSGQQLAFIATGSYGVAIVDISVPTSPVVLSQFSLPGTATGIAVDSQQQVAAIADNAGGLALVSFASLSAPTTLATVSGSFSHVVLFGGIAYASSGASVLALDALTGDLLGQIDGASGGITGLAVDGTTLYTMDSAGTLRAISVVGGTLTLLGSKALPGGGNGLVVGNGVAFIPAGDTGGNGGYVTVDVTDPTHLKLIATDTNRGNAGNAVALNGSGLGLFTGSIALLGQGLQPEFDVVSTADATNTGARVARFGLPATAGDVAVSGGLGYVADGTAGLQVVRYQGFIPNSVAPFVTITKAPVDLDPVTPGTQVIEGSSVPIGVSIASPGQIRTVEVLLNGISVLTDLQYPFDLSVVLPTIAANGSNAVTLTVRAADTNGNVTTTAPTTLLLVPDTTPPRLLSASVSNGGVISTDTHTLQFVFNKTLQAGAASLGNFVLHDPTGATIEPLSISLFANGRTVEAVYGTLPAGAYTYSINAANVRSTAGVPLGAAPIVTRFAVQAFTIELAKPGGGDWNTPANWTTGAVPVATDSVFVPTRLPVTFAAGTGKAAILAETNGELDVTGGTLTVGQQVNLGNATLQIQGGIFAANGPASVARLVMASGSLAGSGVVTVNRALTFSGGTMVAGGITVVGAGATASISGAAILARELDVAGTASISGQFAIGGVTPGILAVQAAGTLALSGTLTVNATRGDLVRNAGTITGNGTLQSITVDATAGGMLYAGDGLTLTLATATIIGGTIATGGSGIVQAADRGSVLQGVAIAAGSTFLLTNNNIVVISGTIADAGTIALGSVGNYTALDVSSAATVQGPGTITLSDSFENRIVSNGAAASLTLSATLQGAGRLGDGDANLSIVNQGTVNANGTNALALSTGTAVAVNTGLLVDTGLGGLLVQSTTVNNATGQLRASGAGSHIDLATATIIGGTLATIAGGVIQAVDRGSSLQNVSILSGTNVTITNNNFLGIAGTLLNAGTLNFASVGNYTALDVIGAVTLTGAGLLALSDNFENRIVSNGAAAVVTLNIALRGAGRLGDGDVNLSIVNQSTISATGTAAMALNSPNTVLNSGVLEDTGSGGLVIQSTTVDDRQGGIIRAVGAGSHVDLVSATIIGGSLIASGGGIIQAVDRGSVLRGTSLVAGSSLLVTNNNILTLQDALSAGANVTLGSVGNYTALSIAGAVTLQAGSLITLSDNLENRITGIAGSTLTNTGLIAGGGRLGDGAAVLSFTNASTGVVNANGAAEMLINVAGGTFVNLGLIEATGTAPGNGGLVIQSSTIDGSGNANAGQLVADGANAHIDLINATIVGGTIRAANGGTIQAVDRASVLQNSTIAAGSTVTVTNNNILTIAGTLTDAGTLRLTSVGNYTALAIAGTTTLAGAGSVALSDNFENRIVSNGVAAILVNAATIQGAGRIGDGDANFTLRNQGTVNASGANAMRIDAAGNVVSNAGTIEDTGSGGLIVVGALLNQGLLWAQTGPMFLAGAVTGTGLARISAASTLEFGSTVASGQQVIFDVGSTGTLRLDASAGFAATIAGLATNGSNGIDLADFAFRAGNMAATFTGTASGGSLQVSNGISTVNLMLSGSYASATFATAQNVSGHTMLTVLHP